MQVRSSPRRKKTASAHWEDGEIVVVVPSHVPVAERAALATELSERLLSRQAPASDDALFERAGKLADRYLDGIRPASIRWVSNQQQRWGSCTVTTREIRMSDRLRDVPGWVLDAALVHELAHLVYPDHSPAFRALADRHPRQHEAGLFLEGYSLGLGR